MRLPFLERLKDGRERGVTLVFLLLLALWFAWTLPLALGERTLILRDVVTTHLPYKSFGAQALAAGSIPAINPTWNLGQPFRGNPNTLAFYPTNLLYLVLPFWSAFNLHYALHWLLGFLGMRALARELGQSEAAALLAAVAWAGSGYFLSLLTFYNLEAVGAWAPWILAGLARGGRRGVALAGLATGMALLGGEPVTAALLLPAMLLVALEGRVWRRALPLLAAACGIGLVVALPQIVATARVLGFTFRSAHGLPAAEAAMGALPLARLLEVVLPLPWGWPSALGRFGFWSDVVTPVPPYIYSLHVGIVAAAVALAAFATRRRWAVLAIGALVAAWAGGLSGAVTSALTLGVVRYPQKLLLLWTIAMALLAGWGLDRIQSFEAGARRRVSVAIATGGGALAVVAALCFAGRRMLAEWMRAEFGGGGHPLLASTAAANWAVGFALSGIVLLAAAWALARGRAAALVVVQAAGLAALAPVVPTDATVAYRGAPPFAAEIGSRPRVAVLPALEPAWEPMGSYRFGDAGMAGATRLAWLNLEAAFGVPRGISYPVAADLEGMTSPLTVLLLRNLPRSDWPARTEWLRRLGVEWIVRSGGEPVAGLERVRTGEHWGASIGLDRVEAPMPLLRWPSALVAAANPVDGFARIAKGEIDSRSAIVGSPVAHVPGAWLELVEERPDELAIDVDGEGGLLVLQRAWLPIYRARLADGTPLRTQPADVALLGIEVPAGKQRVEISISSAPEKIAGGLAVLVTGTLLAVLFRSQRTQPAQVKEAGA